RIHLWRAIAGFVVALIFSFFIGKPVLRFIARPVEEQLARVWDKYYQQRTREINDELASGKKQAGPAIRTPLRMDRAELLAQLGLQEKTKPAINLLPAFERILADLDLDGCLDPSKLEGSRWIEVPCEIGDPERFVMKIKTLEPIVGRPPTLSTLSVQEAFTVYFKVCLATGFVLASPWVFWQIWSFIAAGLYPHEKRLVNVFLPCSLGLFLAGVFVCEFLALPKAIEALLWFNEWLGMQPDLRLNEWLGFAIFVPLVFGISFQTPLVMFFLERVGIL